MAATLKRFFDPALVQGIADEIAAVHPGFPRARFVAEATRGLARLELMDRARHVARALARCLPSRTEEALDVIVRSLGPPLAATEGHGMAPFRYLPHTLFVAEHGLACIEEALAAQHALTQRCSAEFSIRAFLEREPRRTLARLAEWTRDPSPHVRRLVSEGTRPRLPWAGRLRAFQAEPGPVLALLERLKDDPEPTVRRSVANSLNDVGKDHPARLLEVARRWWVRAPAPRRRLVEHALRTLVKRGDARALRILGFGGGEGVSVTRVCPTPPRPRIGGRVDVEVTVENRGARAVAVVLDLVVHFVKRDGRARPKVFKGRTGRLAAGERLVVTKGISLAQHTTRTHHPGRHAVDVCVNGRTRGRGTFTLRR